MVLTQEQVDHFSRNGFLTYGQVLEPDEVEVLRREYDREFERAEREGTVRDLAPTEPAGQHSGGRPLRMLQIMQMCERNLCFRRLIYNARILDVVQDLIGPNIMLFHDQALFKPAHTGGPVFWHQDNAYWRCSPANLVSCWLTLDDVVRESGAMQFLPGSHLSPTRHRTSSVTSALLEVDPGDRAAEAAVVELPAGSCTFHHCQTLHCTWPNTTDRPRRAFAIHYMTPGTRGADGQVIRVSFAHPMLRMCV